MTGVSVLWEFATSTCYLLKGWTVVPASCGKIECHLAWKGIRSWTDHMGWFLNHQYSSSSSSLWVLCVKFGNVFTTFDGVFVSSNVFFQLVAHLDMFIFMPFLSKSKFGVQNHFGNLLKIIWDSGICLYFRLFLVVTWGFTAAVGGRSLL